MKSHKQHYMGGAGFDFCSFYTLSSTNLEENAYNQGKIQHIL